MNSSSVFIAWEHCERTNNLAPHLGAVPQFFSQPRGKSPLAMVWRYIKLMAATLSFLFKTRPTVLFSHNLPPFLVLCVFLYGKVSSRPYILDGHSGAFNLKKWQWFLPAYRFISRRALFCFATNQEHLDLLRAWGATAVLVSDIPVRVDPSWERISVEPNLIVVPCSFSDDEPVEELFDAARRCPNATFKITGNYKKLPPHIQQTKPNNIIFTGYVSRDEYFRLLAAASAVLVLTKRDNTMQRGAYEAMSLERPIITSNWALLRETFGDAAVYVDNNSSSIENGINQMLNNLPFYQSAVKNQRIVRTKLFHERLATAKAILSGAAR